MKETDIVIIDFTDTYYEGNDFISPIGVIEKVLNDATHDTAYLVNGFWFDAKSLEVI